MLQRRILVSPYAPFARSQLHGVDSQLTDLLAVVTNHEEPLLRRRGNSVLDLRPQRRERRHEMLEEGRLGEGSRGHCMDFFKRLQVCSVPN